MRCPWCGSDNRDGASYCDSCGEPLVPGVTPRTGGPADTEDRGPLVGSGGLVGWMASDWLMRFVAVGIIGFVAGFWTLALGLFDYSAFFFLLGIVGAGGTWNMLQAK